MTYVIGLMKKKSRSFTLVELLIVAIIMSILIGLAIPQVRSSFVDIQSKDTCWDVMALMKYAHTRAIIERTRYRVNFDMIENRYWLSFQKEPEVTPDKYDRIKTSIGKTYLLPDTMKIDSMTFDNSITFYPDGTSDDGKMYFSNKNRKGFVLEITGGHIGLKDISQ